MHRRSQLARQSPFFGAVTLLALPTALAAQVGTVQSEQKISETAGGFGGALDPIDDFGWSVSALGDLDGDGIGDLAVGAYNDDDGAPSQGAVWILFLDTDGTVKSEQKISETVGGFGGALDSADCFGWSVTSLGDLDGDGIGDLAVGALLDDDGGSAQGAVWILFLNADGTVRADEKISETVGGFAGVLDDWDGFGSSVSSVGDLDGDGICDLAVGATGNDGGLGAVWILFLDTDGTVKSEQEISEIAGGFGGDLDTLEQFGHSVSALGDLDGDGNGDLAVGARFDDDGGAEQGAVWILFLASDGTVTAEQKISETAGGFGGVLDPGDLFGHSVSAPGDLDGDSIGDLVVGAYGDDDGGNAQGALWVLLLNTDGTVKSEEKISETAGGFGGALDANDNFGVSVSSLGDLDGDGFGDLAVGAHGDDDGGQQAGAVWILFRGPDITPPTISCPLSVSVIDSKSGPSGEVVFFTVTATDDTDPAPSVVCVPPSGSFFSRGATMVTCTATDASGNQSVCAFPVVVMPTIRERRL